MFNPEPEGEIVKKLKDSLKLPEGEDKSEQQLPPQDVPKPKRRHGVGFKIKLPIKKSLEQMKLLSKFKPETNKKVAKFFKLTKNKSEAPDTVESEDESRLDLIFKNSKKK